MPLAVKYPGMVLDSIVDGGCSRRRPDGVLDCGTHCVIVEIDEDQHIRYDSKCDDKRTMELFQDLGSRPLVRLNPDSYRLDGKRIAGAFKIREGEMKANKEELEYHLDELYAVVEDGCVRSHLAK